MAAHSETNLAPPNRRYHNMNLESSSPPTLVYNRLGLARVHEMTDKIINFSPGPSKLPEDVIIDFNFSYILFLCSLRYTLLFLSIGPVASAERVARLSWNGRWCHGDEPSLPRVYENCY